MPLPPAGQRRSLARLWPILLVLLLAAWLRAPGVWQPAPFDVDEALYATYGRQISHEDNPLLTGIAIDKPPLQFYALALSFKWFGQPSEWAARLPSFFASMLTVAVLWRLTLNLYRSTLVAGLAALILALSPLDLTYAGTVFVDPAVTLWISLALLAVSQRHWGASGLFAALAFATKQSALIYVPLIMIIGLAAAPIGGRSIMRFVLVYAAGCALPFLWDAARSGDHVSWWALGAANNAPDRLIRPDEVIPRLQLWGRYLSSASGSIWGLGIGLLGTAWLLRAARPRLRAHAMDMIWVVFILGYSLLYCLVAFSLYPRYAHLLTVPLAIVGARVLMWLHTSRVHQPWRRLLRFAVVAVIGLGASASLATRIDPEWLRPARDNHAGIEAASAFLNTLPPGTIIYDHWAGWLLGWYTGQDRPPGMWLRPVYYPTPEQLAAGALAQPDPQPRYFVAPEWAATSPWIAALDAAGFDPQPTMSAGQFTIYRLAPRQQ